MTRSMIATVEPDINGQSVAGTMKEPLGWTPVKERDGDVAWAPPPG